MYTTEAVALIRDLFVIVATGVFAIVALVAGLLFFMVFQSVRRATRNAEEISSIILNRVVKPLGSLTTAFDEVVARVLGMIQEYRSKERRNEDDER